MGCATCAVFRGLSAGLGKGQFSNSMIPSIGQIGVGGYAAVHLRTLEALRAEGRARLAAVADPSLAAGTPARAAFEQAGVRAHTDYRDLLREGGLDLLIIATPIPLHEEMALAALSAGMQVLLEKPPVPTPRQLKRLIEADPERRCAVAFQLILNPMIRALKRAIGEGRLGELRRITAGACWPRGDGYYGRASWSGRMSMPDGRPVLDGPASNGLAHILHNAAFLASPRPEGFAGPEWVEGGLYRARPEIAASDTCSLFARLEGGVDFAASFAHACEEERPWEMRVFGTRGEARLEGNGARLFINGELVLSCDTDGDRIEVQRDRLRHLTGEAARSATMLEDCLPYLRIVSGGLISSEGVHTLPREVVKVVGEEASRRYAIAGIAEAVRRTIETGETFAEQGLPWARRGVRVAGPALDEIPAALLAP